MHLGDACGRATIVGNHVPVVAQLAAVLDPVAAYGERAVRATTVWDGIGVLRPFVTLLSRVKTAVTTRDEAIDIVDAGISSTCSNDNACFAGTFGMSGEAATEIGITFIGSCTGKRGAAVIDTGKVSSACSTPEERAARIDSGSSNSDTGIHPALRMRATADGFRAGIGSRSGNLRARLVYTNEVLSDTAP